MKVLRERVLTAGAGGLSDAELLALIIRDGTDALSATELAERLLAEFGGGTAAPSRANAEFGGAGTSVGSKGSGAGSALAALAAADVGRIRQTAGCGAVRAVAIAAAGEFARRVCAARSEEVGVVASREDVLRIFAPLAELPHEEFWVLLLTSSGRVIDRVRVSQGGVGGTVVDYRLVVKRALELLASGIVLVHNHPSGAAEPSDEDIAVTERVAEAAALFDIAVVDHVVVSREGSFSFAEAGIV